MFKLLEDMDQEHRTDMFALLCGLIIILAIISAFYFGGKAGREHQAEENAIVLAACQTAGFPIVYNIGTGRYDCPEDK